GVLGGGGVLVLLALVVAEDDDRRLRFRPRPQGLAAGQDEAGHADDRQAEPGSTPHHRTITPGRTPATSPLRIMAVGGRMPRRMGVAEEDSPRRHGEHGEENGSFEIS